jgi:hypothetical protein
MKALEGCGYELHEPLPLLDARPVSLSTPKLWASRALTTPTDDDVYDCPAGHTEDTCHQCSEEKSLQYCLILSTFQASKPFVHGSHFNGKQIYKMIRCGSREAAIAEAFHATGAHGFSIAFSCVQRLGEGFDDKNGNAQKVDKLCMLAKPNKDEDNSSVHVFY